MLIKIGIGPAGVTNVIIMPYLGDGAYMVVIDVGGE